MEEEVLILKQIVIEEEITERNEPKKLPTVNCNSGDKTILEGNLSIDWQQQNETTPQRPCKLVNGIGKRSHQSFVENPATQTLRCKRRLSYGEQKQRPWGFYKLGNIYERIFHEEPADTHRAEGDVIALSRLILHYGREFLNYVQDNAKSVEQVPVLGSS